MYYYFFYFFLHSNNLGVYTVKDLGGGSAVGGGNQVILFKTFI